MKSLIAGALALQLAAAFAAAPNPATRFTAERNAAFGASLPLADGQAMQDATRGKLAPLPPGALKDGTGHTVVDPSQFDFLTGAAPDSVNPSLWRQEALNHQGGLFKVSERIYQVRGLDMSNMTLIEGATGWIVIDPLLTAEAGKIAIDLANATLGKKPVVAVIYTHGHVDHFGGVRGALGADKARIIAPDGFMDSSVSENVLAGNAMTRRSYYQFGPALAAGPRGLVGTGLGPPVSIGTIGLVPPTDIVKKTGEQMDIDGLRFVFQMANGSEAPSEMTFYLPELKALCLSEVVSSTMHNIYTLRGAKTRDALAWSKYINEMLDLFPDAEQALRSHHWPVWGKLALRQHLANQRDLYRYIHDEALFQANQGVPMEDLGNVDFVPKALQADLTTHGYYGTLSHNLRGVYNFYLGWYDGNPATLNRLPRQQSATRYVDAMGGAKAVLAKARKGYAAGDYRWVAEMLNHLVFAQPANQAARQLQADTLEQLGYQAESAIWRNQYLTGAQELRQGVAKVALSTQSPDLMAAMSNSMVFDFLAVRLDHRKTDGLALGINVRFTDSGEDYALELSNSVLNHSLGRVLAAPNASLVLTRAALFKLLVAKTPLPQLIQAGDIKLSGDPKALGAIFGKLVEFDPLFNIVTP